MSHTAIWSKQPIEMLFVVVVVEIMVVVHHVWIHHVCWLESLDGKNIFS